MLEVLFNGFFIDLLEQSRIFAVQHDGVAFVKQPLGVFVIYDERLGDFFRHVLPMFEGVGEVHLVFLLLLAGVGGDVGVADEVSPTHALVLVKLKTAVQEVQALERELQFLG